MESPSAALPARAPAVWTWYRAYCAAMALLYLAGSVAGLLALLLPDALDHANPVELLLFGCTFTACGLPLLALFATAPFLRPTPRTWVFHLVLICVGLTSACCLPVCIPLLVFWIKPETKAFFGRGSA